MVAPLLLLHDIYLRFFQENGPGGLMWIGVFYVQRVTRVVKSSVTAHA